MSELSEAISEMRNMRESYDQIGAAAEAYNEGKPALAEAITAKGVEAAATDSLATMAEKVMTISQDTYEIDGGEMYAKQLFGSLETPNYWNLYDVLAQLLSDGRLVNYGGILLAEYYKGYDSLVLAGAGAGGAYVVSDMENGQFKMYTEDTTHTWATNWDGKITRWVAYCFAQEGHSFEITNTNTSPRNIFIGRNVGEIKNLANGRIASIVVPDGNTLGRFIPGAYANNYDRRFVLKNINEVSNTIVVNSNFNNEVDFYIHTKNISAGIIDTDRQSNTIGSITIICDNPVNTPEFIRRITTELIILKIPAILENMDANILHSVVTKNIILLDTEATPRYLGYNIIGIKYIYVGYSENNKQKTVYLTLNAGIISNLTDIELQDGYCKPIVFPTNAPLTESNMYSHILQRLKQDEPDCGDGVTITLGQTNLGKLTSQESIDLLDELTNTYGYTFA